MKIIFQKKKYLGSSSPAEDPDIMYLGSFNSTRKTSPQLSVHFGFVRLFNRSYPSIKARVETLPEENTKTKVSFSNKSVLSSF